MTKTILLTGAAGFIGRHVLMEAARQGNEDRWLLTDMAAPSSWWGLPVYTRFLAGDLCDVAVLERIFANDIPDVVIHLAGWIGKANTPQNRELLLRSNLMSTFFVLDRIKLMAPARPFFLIPSTGLIYGDRLGPFREELPAAPPDDYSLSKLLAEQTLTTFAKSGVVRCCIIRPAVVYGAGQKGFMFVPSMMSSFLSDKRFAMTAGDQKRDMLYVDDLARAILALVGSETDGVFNVGTGSGTPMKEVGELAAKLLDCPQLLGIGDVPYREREVWDYALDASRLKASVGWEPQVGLEEGLRKTIAWERNAL